MDEDVVCILLCGTGWALLLSVWLLGKEKRVLVSFIPDCPTFIILPISALYFLSLRSIVPMVGFCGLGPRNS